MSAFDPKTFAQMTFKGANSTAIIPVPPGDQEGVITKYEILPWQNKDDPSKAGLKCNVFFDIDSPNIKAVTKRDQNIVRHEFFLDLTPEGMLNMGEGQNVKLGRLREAIGLNAPGQEWSFDMFVGRRALCAISHREYDGQQIAECKAVAKLG
jgi:hypothetical protein